MTISVNLGMEHLILSIKNKNKLPFLKELLKHMEFVEVVDPKKYTEKERRILADLEQAVVQVGQHKKGKIKLKTIQQVLDEL